MLEGLHLTDEFEHIAPDRRGEALHGFKEHYFGAGQLAWQPFFAYLAAVRQFIPNRALISPNTAPFLFIEHFDILLFGHC